VIRLRDIEIKDNTIIRIGEGFQRDVELRIWVKKDGVLVSTRAGLFCPVSKIDSLVSALIDAKSEMENGSRR